MQRLLTSMPYAPKQFRLAKQTLLERIRTERITGEKIYTSWLENRDRGIDHDVREDIYHEVEKMSAEDLRHFFDEHIKNKKYTLLVLGAKGSLDRDLLRRWGEVEEVSLRDLFGY